MLPLDVCRCTGQPIGGAWRCQEREQCLRYLAYREHPSGEPFIVEGRPIPLCSALVEHPARLCEYHIPDRRELSDER